MAAKANDIVRRAWRELPRRDRGLLKEVRAYEWEVCRRLLERIRTKLLHSADRGSLTAEEIARANDALALWVPELRVMLINDGHAAFDGLKERPEDLSGSARRSMRL